jgi:molybdate transport system substrate-binding protein
MRRSSKVIFVAIIVLIYSCSVSAQTALTISAAASLKDALSEAETAYAKSHPQITFADNYGSSGTLAAQIDQGAPVDIFISAAIQPMDELQAKGLIADGTRAILLRNTLVLIAPLDSRLRDFQGLTDHSVQLIALGDPASVPVGQYGRQTLLALHLMNQLSSKFVFGKDVRQVLTYVETGNADAGLVYSTDARISKKIRVVAVAPEWSHDAIIYPIGTIKGTHHEQDTRAFVKYLSSRPAQEIFIKYGFIKAIP